MADKEDITGEHSAEDEAKDEAKASEDASSEAAEAASKPSDDSDDSSDGSGSASASKGAADTSGPDLRWIGYVGGLAIIAVSVMNITGERNMFAPKEVSAEPVAAAVAEGPCADWKQQLCEATGGEGTQACTQAESALKLLTPEACKVQIRALPDTIAAAQAARADCQKLMDQLCGDLGAESGACGLVKSRTPTFPAERCTEMLGQYDKVLDELKKIEARGLPGAGAKPGAPPGNPHRPPPGAVDPHAGHGHAPGAHPGMPRSPGPAGAAGAAPGKPAVVNAVAPSGGGKLEAPKVVPVKATPSPAAPGTDSDKP